MRVGVKGEKSKVQKWCKLLWIEVEMWEIGRVRIEIPEQADSGWEPRKADYSHRYV